MFMKCKVTVDTSHYPKNGPWDLPKGWEWSMLGDISDYGKCVTVPVSAIKDDAWVLELEDIEKETGRVLKHVTKSVRSINGSRHSFSKKQILFSKLRTYLNKVLIAPDKGFCTTEIIPITPQEGIMPEYLSLVLRSPYFLDYTAQCGYGVKMPRLGTSDAVKAFIPIPPFKEQQRITEVVDRYIDILDRIQSEKEEISIYVSSCKSVILDLAIHGKLVPQDHSDEPAIDLLKRINPNFTPSDNLHYKDCPKGWIIVKVADVFEINPKIQGDDDADAGFVPMSNIREGFCNKFSFEVKTWGKIKNGFTRFADGDIAVAKISPCLENRKSVIMRDLPNGIGAGTTELNIFRSRVVNPEYGLLFFKSNYFINACAGSYNGVVGQQRVSRSLIEEMYFLLPPVEEQKRIVATINEYFAVINEISYSLQ